MSNIPAMSPEVINKEISRDGCTFAPLSFAQERLWFLEQLEPDAVLYNIPLGLRIQGPLDRNIFQRCIQEIVKRHEVLRTVFHESEDGVQQVISTEMEIPVREIDLRMLSGEERERKAARLVEDEAVERFHLTTGPLFRTLLIHMKDDECICMVTMHHIVSDGWSMGVMVNEFATLYAALIVGQDAPFHPLPLQYSAFARRQQQDMQSGLMDDSIDYWRRKFERFSYMPLLPAGPVQKTVSKHEADVVHSSFTPELSESILTLSGKLHASPYMTFLAAFSVVFSRYAGSDDIVIGSLIANRNRAELEPLIGFFVNTLPLRFDLSGSLTFDELISRVRDVTLEAYGHQEIPFEKIVEIIQPDRTIEAVPLVQVMIIMQNAPMAELSLEGLTITRYPVGTRSVRFDVEVYLWEEYGVIQCDMVYKTSLFTRGSIERLMGHLTHVLQAVVADGDVEVKSIPLLSVEERAHLRRIGSGRHIPVPQKCVYELFADQVLKHPENLAAVEVAGISRSYRELKADADRIAGCLRQYGIRQQDRIGVCMDRSAEMLAVLLGIMKVGGIYVPMDPAWPSQRTAFVVHDCKMSCIIVDEKREPELHEVMRSHSGDAGGVDIYRADELDVTGDDSGAKADIITVDPSSGVYIIYTSGSTGEPKGVLVEHQSVVNYVTWALRQYGNNQAVDFPLFSSLAFDLTVTSLFVPLISGGIVRIYDDVDSTPAILRVIADDQVDVVKLTPAHLALVLASGFSPKRISCLILGGEDLKVDLARTVHDLTNGCVNVYNEYGPTEATVGCMIHRFDSELELTGSVSIGVPIDNSVICVLDSNLNPAPVGVIGELCIGGIGVAREYAGREELTAEKFIACRDSATTRLYRTGDRARWEENGKMTYLGRVDRQVKIRGYRIEPGEIESILLDYPRIRNTAVVCREVHEIHSEIQPVQNCNVCGMPSNYPGISFNQNGICNMCSEYETYKNKTVSYFRTIDDLQTDMTKGRGDYDCLVLYSGGKDSTYMLCRLVEMGYRILIFTLDNGYLFETARENIEAAVGHLGVDCEIHTPDSMTSILSESLHLYSNVCNGCFKSIYTAAIQTALKKNIPYIVTGLSRGQLFETRLGELFGSGVFDHDEIDSSVLAARKEYHRMDDTVLRTMAGDLFSTDTVFDQIEFIDFYRYCDVTRADIFSYLKKHMMWISPTEIGCSTNCAVNDAGIYVHQRERGYHNYALPGSWEVRIGHRTREDFLAELDVSPDMNRTHAILQKLGYISTHEEQSYSSLVAFYSADSEIDVNDLRGYCIANLPSYMVPEYLEEIDVFPLTINGKVDYTILSKRRLTAAKVQADPVALQTSTEKAIASIWSEVLHVQCPDINVDFFEIGGHSLAATRVIVRIKREFGIDLPLKTLFDKRSISNLATAVDTAILQAYNDGQVEELLDEIAGMSESDVARFLA
jgi:amino acid adenylation domain-containing protein